MAQLLRFLVVLVLLAAVTACGGSAPPPEVTYRLSSPQVPAWVMNVRISRELANPVVLVHMPNEVRELRVQRVNAQNVGTTLCESFGVAKTISVSVKADTATGGYIFNFPEEVGHGEVYAANVVVNFCGNPPVVGRDILYYLGFWFGPDTGFTGAVKFLKAIPATTLQATLP